MSTQELKQEILKTIEEIPESVLKDILEYLKHIKDTASTPDDEDRKFWMNVSKQGIARAYSDDEPEYSPNDVKEPNPLYKSWKKDK
ncbi:MAG: hypothetical protein WCL14_02845 [Bacteroidota bacterium]